MELINILKMREVRFALAVAQTGSILGAANAMNISQPSVTRAIHELEGKLGHKIFNRSKLGVQLTHYGETFLNSATAIAGELQTIQWELDQIRQGTMGTIRIGAMPVGVSGILTHVLNELLKTEPLLNFSVLEESHEGLMQALNDRTIDFVVGRLWDNSTADKHRHDTLFHDSMRVVVSKNHPLANSDTVVFNDLLSWDWVFPPKGTPVYELLVSEFRRRGIDLPMLRVQSLSVSLLASLVANSNLIAALPDSMFSFGMETHDITPLAVDLRNTENPIGVTYLADRELTPLQDRFLQALRCAKVAES